MSLERKLGLSLSGLGSLISGALLFGAINCGAEGSSAKGCKNDNDCKGDRYCDESTNQCISEGSQPSPSTDASSSTGLKTILEEDFDGSSLDTSQWKNYCFKWGCAELAAGEDYSLNNGILKVNYGGIVFAAPFKLGGGKIAVEYKRRNEDFDYAIHGIRDIAGETRLLFWNGFDDGFTAGAGVSQGRDGYDVDKELYIDEDPHVWHTFRIEADTKTAMFTADEETAEFSAKELDSQNELYLWLDGGEYEYVKAWKEE